MKMTGVNKTRRAPSASTNSIPVNFLWSMTKQLQSWRSPRLKKLGVALMI